MEAGLNASRGRQAKTALAAILIVLGLLAAGAAGFVTAGGFPPGDDSAEAGFSRDMQTHHAQAVEMALIVREKSQDPVLRAVAYDIATSQQQQAGQMYGWLTQWGLSQTSSQPRMAWMGSGDMTMDGGTQHTMGPLLPDGRMPGMATSKDLRQLEQAQGRTAEISFLRLMVAHHRGGIAMAETAARSAERPEVVQLARSIAAAQTAETEQLQELLAARGQPPA